MRVGIVGVGFMGWIHYLAYQRSRRAELAAFCSRDGAKRQGDWRGIQGNFGPPGEVISMDGLTAYESLDEMLRAPDLDVIDICLPPHLHAEAIERTIAAGKRAFCEKPLALDTKTARHLAGIGKPGDVMVAHVLPFMNGFDLLAGAASDKRFGAPIAGRFKRTISPPDWIPDFYNPETVGGPLIDLNVHDAHMLRLIFGMPQAVTSECLRRNGTAKFYESLFHFSNEVAVSIGGGVIDSPARGFTHGFEVTFERATVQFEFAAYSDEITATIPLVILHKDGTIERPAESVSDPIESFLAEIDAAAASISGGLIDPRLDVQTAADAIEICHWQAATRSDSLNRAGAV
ncbi:MAG: Gfo/Idh/MocA family oxidoreductase [Planctomycetota bacterium]